MQAPDISHLSPDLVTQIKKYRRMRRETKNSDTRWTLLIKELRATHGCSILEAETIALSYDHLRRWVEKSINTRQKCRKQALAHISLNGDQSLILREGDSFVFRIPKP